jgi:hypothetical protein
LVPPTWEAVVRRVYEPWAEPRLVLDTAALCAEDAAARVCDGVAAFFHGR